MPRMAARTPSRLVRHALIGAALAAAPAQAARLATDVVPTFEQVHLRMDADTTEYSGWVRVELEVHKPTTRIQLHAEGEALERLALTQKGKPIAARQTMGDHGLLTLTTEGRLAKGTATLEIHFANAFNTQAVGLYRMTKNGDGYLFTQFEAEDARKAFPCWDEPGFKFPYQVTVEVPERHQVLSNTPIESERVENGWKTVTFEKTPPLPSYLLALASGPLEFVPIPGVKFPARIVTVKGQSHLAGMAAETVSPVLRGLEEYFRSPYPYRKLDLVAVPEYWFGAMENPGAITYAENILLLDPQTTTTSQRRTLTRITAHELAHMWFGDLVTLRWWDDMWLNESFADWMGDKITEQVAPHYRVLLDEMQSVQEIMETDARPSTEAIRQRLESGNQAMRSVGLAYNKGKAVLGMFEHWVGPESFRRGVNQYLADHAWGSAESGDLWEALGRSSGKDVSAALAGFVEQQGVPLVTVEPLPGAALRLTQKRFLNHGVHGDPLRWQIPVSIRWSDGAQVRTQSVLLRDSSATLQLEGASRVAWVMPNADGRGYYRWQVPPDMLLGLATRAATLMNPAERVAFLGNLAALLDAGELGGDAYLKILAEMGNDPEPLVAKAVIAGVEKARLAFVPDDLQEAFAAYVRLALQPMADRFGFEKRPDEDETVSLVRPQLFERLGRDGRDSRTLALADRLAERFLVDPAAVDPGLGGPSLQLRAQRGDRALFERYCREFENAKNPSVRQRYLAAIGCFDDPALQEAALDYVFSGPLRPNQTFSIPLAISDRSERGQDLVFRWTREHYAQIAGKLPEAFMAGLPRRARGCSAERLAVARQFFADPAHRVPGTDKELAKVAEQVEDCVGLRAREGAAVARYLQSLGGADAVRRAGAGAP